MASNPVVKPMSLTDALSQGVSHLAKVPDKDWQYSSFDNKAVLRNAMPFTKDFIDYIRTRKVNIPDAMLEWERYTNKPVREKLDAINPIISGNPFNKLQKKAYIAGYMEKQAWAVAGMRLAAQQVVPKAGPKLLGITRWLLSKLGRPAISGTATGTGRIAKALPNALAHTINLAELAAYTGGAGALAHTIVPFTKAAPGDVHRRMLEGSEGVQSELSQQRQGAARRFAASRAKLSAEYEAKINSAPSEYTKKRLRFELNNKLRQINAQQQHAIQQIDSSPLALALKDEQDNPGVWASLKRDVGRRFGATGEAISGIFNPKTTNSDSVYDPKTGKYISVKDSEEYLRNRTRNKPPVDDRVGNAWTKLQQRGELNKEDIAALVRLKHRPGEYGKKRLAIGPASYMDKHDDIKEYDAAEARLRLNPKSTIDELAQL
jgi:hypothetical protein